MKRKKTFILVIALMLASAAAGWWIGFQRSEHEVGRLALVHNGYVAGMSANTLKLLDEKKEEKARMILSMMVESSLDSVDNLLSEGIDPGGNPMPNIQESMRRARDYYLSEGNAKLAEQAESLRAAFETD